MDDVYKVVRLCVRSSVWLWKERLSIAYFLLGKQGFGHVWEIVRGLVRVGENEA